MSSMEDLGPSHVARVAAVGDPGTGKSGAIASVVNTGRFKLRVMDLDGNTEPLFVYIKREYWKNVDIVPVTEKLWLPGASDTIKGGEHDGKDVKVTEPVKAKGAPRAFRRIWQLLDDWPEFGPVSEWGPDVILMIDSATPIASAVERKVRHISGTPITEKDWKDQVATNSDYLALFERLKSRTMTPCHLYVTFHRKMIGPREIEPDTRMNKTPELNKKIREMQADLQPMKFFPNAPGRACPTTVGGMFSTLLLFETIYRGQKEERVIRTVPRIDMDIKLPALDVAKTLPLDTGLKTVFNAVLTGGEKGQGKKSSNGASSVTTKPDAKAKPPATRTTAKSTKETRQ